jgi:DedD protein
MEKKKLLLVAISVGVFLVIVIGAALLVISPGNAAAPVSAAALNPIAPGSAGLRSGTPAETLPASVDPADMVRNPGDFRTLQSPPAAPPVISVTNAGTGDGSLRQPSAPQNGENRVVITVPRPSTAAVNDSAPPSPGESRNVVAAARPAASSVPARKPAAPAAKPTPAAAKPAPARPAPQPKAYDAYWVQTGSFSVRNRADTVKETLASKGITSIIENRDVDGKTWYRVRVGPYISQNEADYWLSRIKLIEGFESSQVWKSRVRP